MAILWPECDSTSSWRQKLPGNSGRCVRISELRCGTPSSYISDMSLRSRVGAVSSVCEGSPVLSTDSGSEK